MIIKLDTSVFRFTKPRTETFKKAVKPLTRAQWINADRIVMATMFVAVIIAAIVF